MSNDHIQYMPNEDDTNDDLVINSKENIEKKYYNILINNLLKKNILNSNDIDNIKLKLSSKLFTLEDVISSLEKMINENDMKQTIENMNDIKQTKQQIKQQMKMNTCKKYKQINDDIIYNELLPMQMKTIGGETPTTWSGNYAILNTDKWKVPMTQPPVCINTTPCKVCPSDDNSNSFTGLADWDASRKVSHTEINKKWVENQQQ